MEFKKIDAFFKDKKSVLVILLFSIIIFLIPFSYRNTSFDGLPSGSLPYYHARMAEAFGQGLPLKDDAVYSARTYQINIYDYILFMLTKLIPISRLSFFLPIVFGILSLIFFVQILRQNHAPPSFINIAIILLVTSPLFIFTFTQSNQFSLILFLILLAFMLFYRKKTLFLALPVFAVLSFFGPRILFMVILFLWGYSSYINKEKRFFIIMGMMIALFAAQQFLPCDFGIVDYPVENPYSEFISDLGGIFGIGIMHVSLMLYGFIVFWMHKESSYFTKIVFLILLISIFFVDYSIIFYYNFIISIMGAIALISLTKRKWYSKEMKYVTVLIITCGLLFSTISYMKRISLDYPIPEQAESLYWLRNNMPRGEIFTLKDYGLFVHYLSGNKVIVDEFSSGDSLIVNDMENIYYSRALNTTQDLLERYNVSYLWITEEMKNGTVWHDEDEGLLFLLRNNKTFKQIYNDAPFVEIWEVVWVTRHFKIIDKSNESIEELLAQEI